jgi:methylated-DNA-protein-cysteine methyltransferase-like protein
MFNEFYTVVKNIPKGHVMTYGDVARVAGFPRCARQVGFALHRNPEEGTIPCHRVVFADGSLSPAFAFGGRDRQKQLLENEGVVFVGERVDMKKCRL